MAEEKTAIELDDDDLDTIAGGDDSVTNTYSVYCFQCGNVNGCLGTGLSFDDAFNLAQSHNAANSGHKARPVPENQTPDD